MSVGCFCHGAVGIPKPEYNAVHTELESEVEQDTELRVPRLQEFTHTEFTGIPFAERWGLRYPRARTR